MYFVAYFIAGWFLAFASARIIPGKLARTCTAFVLCIAFCAALVDGGNSLEPMACT